MDHRAAFAVTPGRARRERIKRPDGRSGLRSQVKSPKRRRRRRSADEGAYVCPSCGERIVIPLDLSQGRDQQYVEDCPVCCNPNVIRVELDPAWEEPRVWAERE